MRKKDEISKTATCLHSALPDEMVFVLLGRDQAAPVAIRQWAQERIALGKNVYADPQIVEAFECARTMERERLEVRMQLAASRFAGELLDAKMQESRKLHSFEATENLDTGYWTVTCSCGWLHTQVAGVGSEAQAQAAAIAHATEMTAGAHEHLRESIPSGDRSRRQETITEWARTCFGVEQATSLPQRGVRLLEGSIEAYQAAGGDAAMAHKLVDFVFGRPPGDLAQELGGVGVCVLIMASALGVTADSTERNEVERVLAKPFQHFIERNHAKNAAGFLASAPVFVPMDFTSTSPVSPSRSFHDRDVRGKRLWCEDDCTTQQPDHETLRMAWERLTGSPFSKEVATASEDCGDGDWLRMPNGWLVWYSYPGGSEIWSGSGTSEAGRSEGEASEPSQPSEAKGSHR